MAARLSTERVLGRLVRFTARYSFSLFSSSSFLLRRKTRRGRRAGGFEDGHPHFTSLGRSSEDRRNVCRGRGTFVRRTTRMRLLTRQTFSRFATYFVRLTLCASQYRRDSVPHTQINSSFLRHLESREPCTLPSSRRETDSIPQSA